MQCLFSDARRIVLPMWTANFITVCVEVPYGTVGCEGSCCTRVTTLDEVVENESTLSTKEMR
jgi:hypothetical protein